MMNFLELIKGGFDYETLFKSRSKKKKYKSMGF